MIKDRPFLCGFILGGLTQVLVSAALSAMLTLMPLTLESQVRTWAGDYPDDLRNKWAWCYLDSAANWSTDQQLREDVRLKSAQVLSDGERQTLVPLDALIAAEIPKQNEPLKEVYHDVGTGLKTAEWKPPPAPVLVPPQPDPQPKPKPPIRRRFFRRR